MNSLCSKASRDLRTSPRNSRNMTKIGLRTFAVPTPQPLRQTNGRAQVRQILLGKSPFLVISLDGAGADFVIDRICTLRFGMGPVLGCGGVGPEPKAILVSQPLRRNKYGIVVALHPGTANTVLSRPFQRNVAPDRLLLLNVRDCSYSM